MPAKIVDSCCLINLYATGNTLHILEVYRGELYVPQVVRDETLTIRKPSDEDVTKLVTEAIDLREALDAGLLQECCLNNELEVGSFVRFASELDDGEAVCLAIAKSRGWAVATDDRKAIRVATEVEVATITTAELVRRWVDVAKPCEDQIGQVLRRIEQFARFRPRKASPLSQWWAEMCEK